MERPSGPSAPFWLRSIRRRPAAAVLLALIAAMAAAASVLAPLLLRAVEQVTLADAFDQAGLARTSVAVAAQIDPGATQTAENAALTASASLSHEPRWTPPVTVAETTSRATWTGTGTGTAASGRAPIAGITGCGGLSVTGACPKTDDQLLAPTGAGLHTGDTARIVVPSATPGGAQTVFTARVVGTYEPTGRVGRITSASGRLFGAGGNASPDLLVPIATFDSRTLEGTVWVVRTITPATGIDDLGDVRDDLRSANQAALTAASANAALTVVQHVGAVLDGVDAGRESASLVVLVTALQVLALAWAALAVVVARVGRARSAEWGLARLRGLPRRRRLGTVLLEPTVAVLVGSVVGLAAAVPLAGLAARLLFSGPSADAVVLDPFRLPVVAAALTAVAGSAAALVVASVRPARLPLVDLLRRTAEPRMLSRTGAVVQAIGIVAAAVVIAAIVTEQRITGPGIALLAPTLVAVLVAVVALRVAVPLVRRAGRRSGRTPTSLAGMFVVRRIARTPSVLTTAVVVAIGVAIVVSSCQTAVFAERLQRDRAAAELGASTVLEVRTDRGVSLVDAVREADPDGRTAMAAQTLAQGIGVGRVVAVDTSRLGVTTWRPDWAGRALDTVQRALRPSVGPSLRLTGDHLALTLADVGLPGSDPSDDVANTELVAVVQNATGWHDVDLGAPADGVLTAAAPCTDGCRLVSLGLQDPTSNGQQYGAVATITRIATSTGTGDARPVDDAWLRPDRWRDRIGENTTSRDRPTGSVGESDGGLSVRWYDTTGSSRAEIAPRDAPEPLPALIGSATSTDPFPGIRNTVSGIALDGSSRLLRVVGRAPTLPRVLDDGALVDLPTALLVSDPGSGFADEEVWLAPGSHPGVVSALRAEGVHVTATKTLAAAEARAEQSAPTLAALIGLVTGAGALVLTLLAALAVGLVGAGAGRDDVRVLRTAGFDVRRIRWALVAQAFTPAAVAVVLGAVAGTVGTVLVAGRLPLRDGDAPPVGVPVGPWTVTALALVSLAVLAVIALVTAQSAVRGTTDEEDPR